MESRWDDGAAAAHGGPVGECVYCTRLIGGDPSLVLHGGGNSSVKAPVDDITGTTVDALHVKGSGWDMATIEAAGLTPLRLSRVRELLEVDRLSDPDMMRELGAAKLDPGAPNPSVETLLHAYLPHRAVQHSHADVIVNITNLGNGHDVVRDIYGDDVVVVPYVMPGFDLARLVRDVWPDQSHAATVGMVLLNHGLFTFGETSAEAYRHHVELVSKAEQWLDQHAPVDESAPVDPPGATLMTDLADLRRTMSEVAGRPLVVQRHTDEATRRFVGRADHGDLATRGPLTPDHVIRTKRVPMIGRDVAAYAEEYSAYVARNASRARTQLTELDGAPRVVLDPQLGMLTAGPTVTDAQIAADIYHHTMAVLTRAEDHLGGYVALPEGDIFDLEYWDLEQAKLARGGARPELTGQVAVVTGAASGIGRACARALLERGACVTGIDRSPSIADTFSGAAWHGVAADVTDAGAQLEAIEATVERFGGIDVAVVAAGIFGASVPIAELEIDEWRAVMEINLDSVVTLLRGLHPLLVRSPVGGRVVVIGSKNVPAPGKGAAAYSSSKAALTQLTRIAALEWADDGIRVNTVHPDAVFDTGLWTDELLAERAARYDLSVDDYKRRNLLRTEVRAATVGAAVAALCGDAFSATTGAQIPIDGGNERVI
ncbi:MAG: bifunctional aldolase/short-chain dehydrogenase [Acidimicrobiia bacterium]|nr:bifunctional aldolase/short-chain dehydrogenase [Acidimicrobiia bacterium]MDH5236716.1 bifunctional aldolase/short-chain dehydrogenase [Acidimicrobiia bacterium]